MRFEIDDIFNEISEPSNWMTLCANCQTFIAAMHDDDLSPEERVDVDD